MKDTIRSTSPAVKQVILAGSEWRLTGLSPDPVEEWDRMKSFLGLGREDIDAMLRTVEVLFRRGPELVVNNYNYLLATPETAALLGWEQGADPQHLSERRRFFTVWLARLLGMDLGHDFARYLYRAGQIHAGHGPRAIHVPEIYVSGAVGLVQAAFARFLSEEMPTDPWVLTALAGWGKVLQLHLRMMLAGYQSAVALDEGDFRVPVYLFARMRELAGRKELSIGAVEGGSVAALLHKFFNYLPQLRGDVFDIEWVESERVDAVGNAWLTVGKAYRPRAGWRVLVNGQNIDYLGGPDVLLHPSDRIDLFPPGR